MNWKAFFGYIAMCIGVIGTCLLVAIATCLLVAIATTHFGVWVIGVFLGLVLLGFATAVGLSS